MRTLIICEKPAAAAKVAGALAENGAKKRYCDGVPYYELERHGDKVVVVSALGHLFALKNLKPMKDYPFFEVGWVPTHLAGGNARRAKNFRAAIQQLAKEADNFVVATDFDNEGSLIGYNVLLYLCGEGSVGAAKRMKFSTLTAEDLTKSYESMLPSLDFENINAGMARHFLDWYWGMNLSLAMSSAVKRAKGGFAKLSAGRVQTPTLKILADREKEIASFKPVPFWTLRLLLEAEGMEIEAEHDAGRFWDNGQAERALEACAGKPASISSVHSHRYERPPPVPFNLGTLQSEAYRCFGFSPMRTQKIAQELYQAALISYPRTDSQKLPPAIGYAKIIGLLGKGFPQYRKFSEDLLALPELIPSEGDKVDPAHPAIFPTGERPKGILGPQKKLHDLIVRRFFSVFGGPALIESTKVNIVAGGENFHIYGQQVLKGGWMEFYGPYSPARGPLLPAFVAGQTLPVKGASLEAKETAPPPRYNQASILKEMEARRLGTKGTRATILQNIQARGYAAGNQISVTELGLEVLDSLEKHCPEIVSESLTSRLERKLEAIQEGSLDKNKLLAEARAELDKILGNFRKHELEIGKALAEAYHANQKKGNILGKCRCGDLAN